MKRIVSVFILMIMLLTAIPLSVSAAPPGYMEVKLTNKNVKKYLEIKKQKRFDEFGDYNGYSFGLYSKMRKKGYYVYSTDNIAVKLSGTHKSKYKYKKKWKKNSYKFKNWTLSLDGGWWSGSPEYNYKYAKLTKVKYKKVKGTMIFVRPENVRGVKLVDIQSEGTKRYHIMLKYPYDQNTSYESHWDEAQDKEIIDYYYITRYVSRNDNELARY